ncbi:MAG: transposase [Dehalococcoidia bacterium]|nr:transposase [Dehalococcoidia bacterium]
MDISRSSISRANQALKKSFNNWRKRDLSQEDIIYLFLDGIYPGVRSNSWEKEAVLVAHGMNRGA